MTDKPMTDAEYIAGIADHYKGKGIADFEQHYKRLTAIATRLAQQPARGGEVETENARLRMQMQKARICLLADSIGWREPGSIHHAIKHLDPDETIAQPHTEQPVDPFEMRICEVAHVILKPNMPYVFTVDPNCEKCQEVARSGDYGRRTQPAAEGRGEVDDAMVERAARAVERATTAAGYGWTDKQFETWWNRDPFFMENKTNWGYFEGTRRDKLLWETRIALAAVINQENRDG